MYTDTAAAAAAAASKASQMYILYFHNNMSKVKTTGIGMYTSESWQYLLHHTGNWSTRVRFVDSLFGAQIQTDFPFYVYSETVPTRYNTVHIWNDTVFFVVFQSATKQRFFEVLVKMLLNVSIS